MKEAWIRPKRQGTGSKLPSTAGGALPLGPKCTLHAFYMLFKRTRTERALNSKPSLICIRLPEWSLADTSLQQDTARCPWKVGEAPSGWLHRLIHHQEALAQAGGGKDEKLQRTQWDRDLLRRFLLGLEGGRMPGVLVPPQLEVGDGMGVVAPVGASLHCSGCFPTQPSLGFSVSMCPNEELHTQTPP